MVQTSGSGSGMMPGMASTSEAVTTSNESVTDEARQVVAREARRFLHPPSSAARQVASE